jgi:MoxR-like ATPase
MLKVIEESIKNNRPEFNEEKRIDELIKYLEHYKIDRYIENVEDWYNSVKNSPVFEKIIHETTSNQYTYPYSPKYWPYGESQWGIVRKILLNFITTKTATALYGPPGTGKTVLAEASANVFFMILDKYIGLPNWAKKFTLYQMNPSSVKSAIWLSKEPTSNNGILEFRYVPQFLLLSKVLGHVVLLDEFTHAPEDIQGFLNSIFELSEVDIPPYGKLPVSPLSKLVIAYNPPSWSNTARSLSYTIENRIGLKIPVDMPSREDLLTLAKGETDAPDFLIKYAVSLVLEARKQNSKSSIRHILSMCKILDRNIKVLNEKEFSEVHSNILKLANQDEKVFIKRVAGRLWIQDEDVLKILSNKDYRSFVTLVNEIGFSDFVELVTGILHEEEWHGLVLDQLP